MEWSLIDGVLTISGEITHTTESYSDWPWFLQRTNITSVKFSDAFFAVGSNACSMFYNCTNLTSFDLSSFDTSNVISMNNMFGSCTNLISLDLSGFNTSNVTSMNGMFYNCSSLTSLDLSSFNTSNVTSMGSMFGNCRKLASLDLLNFNTSNVNYMGYMFEYCSDLTSLDLSSFDTSNVTDMIYMFHGCSSLISLDLSSFNTSKVTNMDYMFYSCSALTSLDLSNFDTSNVTDMVSMFRDCQSLTSLNLSSFNTSNVISMGNMFNSCINLISLNLLSFDTSNVTSMSRMFYYCQSLISLDLSSFNTSNVTSMNYMFDNCSDLMSIRISNLWTTNRVNDSLRMFYNCTDLPNYNSSYIDKTYAYAGYDQTFGWGYLVNEVCVCYDSSDRSLSFIGNSHGYTTGQVDGTKRYFANIEALQASESSDIPWSDYTVEMIRFSVAVKPVSTAFWFYTEEIYPTFSHLELLNTSNVNNMSYMFYGCGNSTSLDLSNFDTSKVEDMSYMFYGCRALTSLNLSNFNTSNVFDMTDMFRGCQSLTSLNLSSFDTSNVTSMMAMFYNCTNLTSLDLSNFDTSKVTNISSMFRGCRSLTSLDLSSFSTSIVTNMGAMFYNCSSLTSLDLSSFSTLNVTDMTNMFAYCSANIPVLYLDTVHNGTSIFTGSTGKIYLVRRNPEEDKNNNNVIRNDWRNYITRNNYINVFLEYDRSTRPTASLVLNRGKFENNKWEADEIDGGVIKIELHSNVYNDNKATVLDSNAITSVELTVNKDNYIKNTDYTVDYQAANDLIYLTLLTLPGNQYDITATITDKSDIPVSFTAIVPGIFAMIEFRAGGQGMSIGKICERDGLEISIPTAIGKGLLPPVDQQGNFDLTNYQLVIGKYNEQKSNPLFIIGNGTDDTHRSNLMEVGNNSIIIGNINNTHTVIDGNGQRICANDGTPQFSASAQGVTKTGDVTAKLLRGEETEVSIASGSAFSYSIKVGNQRGTGTATVAVGIIIDRPGFGKIEVISTNSTSTTFLFTSSENAASCTITYQTTYDLPLIETLGDCHIGNELIVDEDISTGGDINIASGKSYKINNTNMFDLIYPVGSIYMSVNSTDPGTLFGGQWTPLQNRFLFAAGSFHTAGTEGGSRYIQAHTHSFTGASHSHPAGTNMAFVRYNYGEIEKGLGERKVAAASSGNYTAPVVNDADVDYAYAQYTGSETAGGTVGAVTGATTGLSGSTAEGNMPPYLTVYMWKRTA